MGDTITAVDGTTIANPDDLGAAIARHQPGDQVDVSYTRGAATLHANVTLGTRSATGN